MPAETESDSSNHLTADSLIFVSDEPLKSLERKDGKERVGSYAIRFSGPDQKDLQEEYFTAGTDFGTRNGDGAATMFHHGTPMADGLEYLASKTFAPVKAFKDDVGIFVETVLNLADEYEKAIAELVLAGKLKWSSATAAHLMRKAADGRILRWHPIEFSYTPTPAEPRLPSIMPLKSVKIAPETAKEIAEAFATSQAAIVTETIVAEPIVERVDRVKEQGSHAADSHAVVDNKSAGMTEANDAAEKAQKDAAEQKLQDERVEARTTEISEIYEIGDSINDRESARQWVKGGKSLADYRAHVLANVLKAKPVTVTPTEARDGKYNDGERKAKSVGQGLIESDDYKKAAKGSVGEMRNVNLFLPDTKATLLTSTGPFTSYDRPSGIVMVEQERLTVRDLLAQGETSANSIRYMQEDTYTNAATTVAEEGLKPEATFDLSEVDAPIRKIAVIGRVSDESFADFPMLQSYVDQRLRFMLKEREEAQLLNGAGTGTQLTGILQTSGIQTQAVGADKKGVAVFKGMTKVRAVGRFEPSGIVIHPTDYQTLRIDTDANNQFYGGGYFYAPYGNGQVNGGIMPLWGLPCVVTTNITQGTALVGAFKLGAMIFDRLGVRVDTTNSDASDFQYNRIAIRVEERLALVVWRPLAFCKVTGL